jgi:hypothetical protein
MKYISPSWPDITDCGSCHDFLDKGLLLTRKLLNQGNLLVKLKSSLRKFYVATITVTEYMCPKWPQMRSISRKHFPIFPHSWFITEFVARVARRAPLVWSRHCLPFRSTWVHPGFRGVRVAWSCAEFCISLFVPLSFFFWPLCYLSLDLRIMNTPLGSSKLYLPIQWH